MAGFMLVAIAQSKRKLKNQPITGQTTYTSMFQQLQESKWYFILDLLKQE